jgi:hypothetical protein
MIKHIVLLKFKENCPSQDIEWCFKALAGLKDHIPEILSFNHGCYRSQEGLNQGYGHGFEMEFSDERCRDIYLDHQVHKDVAGKIIPLLEDGFNSVIAFDYEIPRSAQTADTQQVH